MNQKAKAQYEAEIGHSLLFGGKKEERGVAMSETQYDRIQKRIRKETGGGAATSIWLALAFAFASFGTSAWLALGTLDKDVVSDKVEGRLEGAELASVVLVGLCLMMHFSRWRKDHAEGNDICHEMDIYCHRQPDSETKKPHWWSRNRTQKETAPTAPGK